MNTHYAGEGGLGTTVVAIASPMGTGAVSLIRMSGPQALEIADRATAGAVRGQQAREARYCRVRDAQGGVLDDGILTVYRAPASFTGEDSVEFTGHGGVLVTREVLTRFLECGAELAGPGEFSRRAFLNGKLDLTQAEGIMDLISAQTKLSMRAARAQLAGRLGKKTEEARDQLLEALAHLEAWIDFPEEDIDPQTGAALRGKVEGVLEEVKRLLNTADQGRILREGVRTVIFGEPNVGKSSLLNRLLGFERAIVSEVAGTTRDTIEELINLKGVPLRLVDTAGVRDTEDRIEAAGIERTVQQIEEADLLLEILDGSEARPAALAPKRQGVIHLRILNKMDLGMHGSWVGEDVIPISCVGGEGVEGLAERIREELHLGEVDWGEQAVAINARHQLSLERARVSLEAALAGMGEGMGEAELVSVDLREALDFLGEIPGKVDSEDLLGVIFSTFCIGK